MSLIRRGLEARNAASTGYFGSTYNPTSLLYGNTVMWSTAGERVDEVTSLGVASVLSCVSLLADSVATMPLRCTTMAGGVRKEVPAVLADPDPATTTGFELIHTTTACLALHGNAYLHIQRDSRGEPIGVQPLHPYQVNVVASRDYQGRQYLHLGNPIAPEDMLHIRWFTPPQSLVGISPILQQRTTIGLAIAVDRYLAGWYGDGGTPSGVLSTDQALTREAMEKLRETWESSQRKRRRPAVLTDGLKWTPVQTSAVDMEFNTTRDAITADVARIFRIPGFLLGIKSDGMTYMNVEQASLNYLMHTLQPWITRLEVAFSTLLPDGVDVTFDPSSLLRLDAMTKARVQLTQIQSGTRSPNEARAVDGLEPYDGGDAFYMALPGAPLGGDSTAPVGEDVLQGPQVVANA